MSLIFLPVFTENKRHPGRSVMNGAVLSAPLRAFPRSLWRLPDRPRVKFICNSVEHLERFQNC